ncbi:hypothetical protein N0V90_002930 [Kalmusia sp. IMI 367209]|nr:hypothetical protein N0V90_002930 [Kalmusia sp. IMI 367209]
MVSFSLITSLALLASTGSVSATPFAVDTTANLQARQAQLPPDCTVSCFPSAGCVANYTVAAGENCGTVVNRFNNFTATDLFAWNPEILQTCTGLQAYVPVCIGVPGYQYPGPVKGGDTKAADQTPVPVQAVVSGCTKYEYTDSKGVPSFSTLLSTNHITQHQWNVWNWPDRNPDDNLAVFAGYFSCVAA